MNSIFISAIIFSIWYVVLFWGKNLGLSMLLFVVPFTYYLITILEKKEKIKYKKSKILIIPITLLSSTYFLFNNKFFNSLNIVVIPILILLMIVELLEKNLKLDSCLSRFIDLIFNPISYFDVTMKKIKELIKIKLKIKTKSKKSNVLKALCITVPIVIFILILLGSADEIFGNIFINIIKKFSTIFGNFEISQVIGKLICIVVIFLYLVCFFDNLVYRYNPEQEENNYKNKESDLTTIKMLLATLNIVYILFCIIQVKSLFIGTNIENYSEYARKGFFQLMLVSFINLVVILFAKINYEPKKFINSMCLLMISCTFIILISSAYRMYLYENAYGYTLLRLLVYVELFTESILLIPTIIYVLDKPIKLLKVYFWIGICIYVCVNFINIDNIIAKRNIDRYVASGNIDIYYLTEKIGTDAVNQMIRIINIDPQTIEQETIKKQTKDYLYNLENEIDTEKLDFRNFNISKYVFDKVISK